MKVFVSYSRHDKKEVQQIINDCKSLGHSVWFDQELSGGQSWWDRIIREIQECDLFVFVLSQQSTNSAACTLEYNYAHQLNKRILPVLVSEVSINLLPPALNKIQYVDYRKSEREAVLDFVKALNSLPPAQEMPDPLPAPPEVPISYLGNLKAEIEADKNLSFEEQSALLFKLKERLKHKNEEKDVHELLRRLKDRDELFFKIAQQIDTILEKDPAVSARPPKPKTETVGSATTKTVDPQPQVQASSLNLGVTGVPAASATGGKKLDSVAIIGVIGGIFIPILGIILGIWSLRRIANKERNLKGTGWAWGAIIVGILMMFVYLYQGIMNSMLYYPTY